MMRQRRKKMRREAISWATPLRVSSRHSETAGGRGQRREGGMGVWLGGMEEDGCVNGGGGQEGG